MEKKSFQKTETKWKMASQLDTSSMFPSSSVDGCSITDFFTCWLQVSLSSESILSIRSWKASAYFLDLASYTSSTMHMSRLIFTTRGFASDSCTPNRRLLPGFSSSGPGGGIWTLKLAEASRCLKWRVPTMWVKWRPFSAERGLDLS